MSASPDTSFFDPNISELSEDEPLPSSAPSIPRIKLKLRLNPTASSSTNHSHDDNSSKKHKRKKKRSQKKHKHNNHSDDEEHQHRRHSELVDIDDYEQPSDSGIDDDKYPDYAHMPVGGKRPFAMLAQDTQDENETDDIDTGATYDQPVYDEDEEQSYTDDDQQIDEDDTYMDDYDDDALDESIAVYPTDTSATAFPSKKSKTNRSSKAASKTSSKTKGKTSKQSSKDAKSKAAKKRGRPTKKAQAKASASSAALPPLTSQPLKQEQQYQGTAASKDHGKGLKATCFKLWDTLSKRDAYGFFLEPVDTKIVRDYLTVIKQPMDFSTLYRKIENDNYKTMDDFRTDFLLIVRNAKLYNAPDTIYWKSADKLENYGSKAIERAEKLVQEPVTTTMAATQPHRPPFSTYLGNQQYSWQQQQQQQQQQQLKTSHSQKNVTTVKEEEVDILGLDGPARKGSRAESERPTREPSLDPNSRAMTPMRQQPKKKKKKKVTDSGVIYGPDGSIHAIGGVSDLHSLLPRKQSFSDPPQLTTINPQALPSAFYQPNRSIHDDWASHKHFAQPAIFCDYGPFPFTTLGSSTPAMFYQQQDARYVYSLYGDDTGEAYLKSVWRFLDDLGLGERAATLSRTITRGAFDVMAAVVDNMENTTSHGVNIPSDDIDRSDDNSNKSSLVLDTELGEVDIGALLSELQQRPTDDTSTKMGQQNQQMHQSTSLPPPPTSDEKVNVSATGPMHASESPSTLSATPVNAT